jgi:hypothetical protein
MGIADFSAALGYLHPVFAYKNVTIGKTSFLFTFKNFSWDIQPNKQKKDKENYRRSADTIRLPSISWFSHDRNRQALQYSTLRNFEK